MSDYETYADHEQAFLSCFFTDAIRSRDNLLLAGCNITPDMLTTAEHKKIYKAVLSLLANNIIVDPVTIRRESEANAQYIAELVSISKSPAYVADYGRYILDDYRKKQFGAILEAGQQMLEKKSSEEVQKYIAETYNAIGGNYTADRHEIKAFDDVATEYLQHEARLIELEAQGLGITGSKFLDDNIFFDLGYVMIIGGRSGVGKTTIGLKYLADYCQAYQTAGLFVSLEMPVIPVFRRAMTTEYCAENKQHDSKKWISQRLRAEREKYIMQTIDRYKNILICDSQGVNLADIEQQIHKARRKIANLENVLIDYLGYIKSEDGKTITEQVANIARGLKSLAKKLKIRLIVLSQLNREGGTDGTTPVASNHFKDSGAIEESADIAIGIWRSAEFPNRMHGIILKNREGELGIRTDYVRYGTHLEEVEPIGEIVQEKKKKWS